MGTLWELAVRLIDDILVMAETEYLLRDHITAVVYLLGRISALTLSRLLEKMNVAI